MIYLSLIVITMIVAALYVFAIMPGEDNAITLMLGWYYAHRGLHSTKKGIPENTLPAFQKAVEEKYGIELDVRASKDGHVVVFHDDNLLRACNVNRRVSDMTYEELKNYRLFNTHHRIPLLTEVLDLVDGKVPLIIELKSSKNYKLLCRSLCDLLQEYKGVYCIESFDPRIVRWFRVNQPHVIRGQLSANLLKEKNNHPVLINFSVTYLLTNFMSRPDFIAYKHEDVDNLSFLICRRMLKAKTIGWTVRRIQDMEQKLNLFDLLIFEDFMP